uniref:Uncharacterized protein n=1 Tax=Craspedostauros australis TaxID=1486917 RepID=A0A7R9WZB5_9STRA
MIDTLIFAHQHSCSVLEDAAMRVVSQNTKACLAHPDFNKITQQPQLMGGIQVLCSGGTVSDGVDDEYSHMSMMELYKVVDEDEGSAQVDSYMDRATLVGFVRSIKSSFETESNSAAEEEDK